MADFSEYALRLREGDDVAVLKKTWPPEVTLVCEPQDLTTATAVPAGHKIALLSLTPGAPVHKYGQVIGFAARAIAPGEHVHTHNLELHDFKRDWIPAARPRTESWAELTPRFFPGYDRGLGRVGTRNYIAVISSVNCSASVSHYVRDHFRTGAYRSEFPHVDGVIAFTHKSGCCVQPGEPYQLLQRVMMGLARHPNIAGFIMIGLGCEGHQVSFMRRDFQLDAVSGAGAAPSFMNIQALGGVQRTVEAGIAAVAKLFPHVNGARRTEQPVSKLILAENCGGSDGASGITANPALGVASDTLIRHGGTSVLAETPEIYGAEHLLAARAATPEVAAKLMELIRWWEEHARQHGATINNNPSFGNKEGGLTTIHEKSLGAVAKGGQAPLQAVYKYAEQIVGPGLCFMDTPGFDPVSMTGLMAGGCNVAVFTTGRGSVYGCKPTPCIKVATNSTVFNWMRDDMDLNAGTILDGTETVEEVGQRILEKIISVAGGERTKSELAGMGDEEFAPWLLGPTF